MGDATRTMDGSFRFNPNQVRIIDTLVSGGLVPLPKVLWRKPPNSEAEFMGSGMRPPNAYVTLEHEFILLARKPRMRSPDPDRRDRSAYFWVERNDWFSDVWEVRGERQAAESGPRGGPWPAPSNCPID